MKIKLKFQPGDLVVTNSIAEMIAENRDFNNFVAASYQRYLKCDWGDMCAEDKKLNRKSLKTNQSLHGVYKYSDEITIWIITEWDRSKTTLLLPHER